MATVKHFACQLGRLLQISVGERGTARILRPWGSLASTPHQVCAPLQLPPFRYFSTMMSPIDDDPFPNIPISDMSNEELSDPSTIPGWNLIHSPPRKYPRGALIGTVVSDKMDKTVNVAVVRYRIVPKIRKRVRYTRKFMAHDEKEVANMGDSVMITPCHRISKNKHFMLREIIRPKGQL
jgi:small subunit ribosomal protein S17